jgi:putative transposase
MSLPAMPKRMQLLSTLSAFTTKTGFIQQQNTYRRWNAINY